MLTRLQTRLGDMSILGVPVTENNGRFGKWSGVLGQLINMIKWVTGGMKTAFGARGSALGTPGGPYGDKWAQNGAQMWHATGC